MNFLEGFQHFHANLHNCLRWKLLTHMAKEFIKADSILLHDIIW
jgi:hypothetical protein